MLAFGISSVVLKVIQNFLGGPCTSAVFFLAVLREGTGFGTCPGFSWDRVHFPHSS